MSRSLAELASLVADTNLDPFDRMCHAASLTNQAHAATANLLERVPCGAKRAWRTWGESSPCRPDMTSTDSSA
jgi:hypothetical protein